MSLNQILSFPHVPSEIYDEYKKTKNVKANDFNSIGKELSKLFNQAKSGDKLAQLILYDFYLTVNNINVYKENITGKRIEQRLAKLFALSTGDELQKSNPDINKIMLKSNQSNFDKKILDLVCSNYREKGDLFFYKSSLDNIYKLSIKSLVPENNEVNFGAFEFQSTIKGIIGLEKLEPVQERKRTINITEDNIEFSNIGIGSTKQLKSLFQYITYKNLTDIYLKRFEILLRSVYKDDFMLYIKNPNHFKIYLIENDSFIRYIMSLTENGFLRTRYEGNSIRITGISNLIQLSSYSYEYEFLECMPDFYKIEKLLLDLSHDKSIALRSFIQK